MKSNVMIATLAAGAVIGGGTLVSLALGSTGEDAQRPHLSSVEVGGVSDSEDGGGRSAAERACASALARVPGAVTGIEWDTDDGETVWEVVVLGDDGREHEVRVSEDGAEVLGSRIAEDDDWETVPGGISAAEAIRIAQDHTSAVLREAELDDDSRSWELELRGDDGGTHELTVDAATGAAGAAESGKGGDDKRDDDRDDGRWDDDDRDPEDRTDSDRDDDDRAENGTEDQDRDDDRDEDDRDTDGQDEDDQDGDDEQDADDD